VLSSSNSWQSYSRLTTAWAFTRFATWIVRQSRTINFIIRIRRRRFDELVLKYSHPIVCMKQHLLLVLVALGLVAVTPREAQAGVHFGFSFGFPAYYGDCYRGYYPYYGPYYGGYSYCRPYWYHHYPWVRFACALPTARVKLGLGGVQIVRSKRMFT
jgi:hypothetical protein